MERVLATHGRFAIHSNDITIYSCAIGAYYANRPLDFTINPRILPAVPWLPDFFKTPADQLASLMLFSHYPAIFDKEGNLREHSYYQRIFEGLQRQYPDLHAKTVRKLEALQMPLASFSGADAVDWINDLPEDAGFVSYPPFFGSEDYIGQYAKLEQLFDWKPPSYQSLSGERIQHLINRAMSREHWLFASNHLLEEYRPYLRGKAQTSNRGVPIYLYASRANTRVVAPHQAITPVHYPRLAPRQPIGDTLSLHILTSGQFKALRSQYMNPFIRPGSETQAYAATVDGKLVGVFAVSTAPSPANYSDLSSIYLLSDFPVFPTDYPRLSKLVLYAALSKEAQLLFERVARHRIRRAATTAFSENPVSMKYRGLFDLHSRKQSKPKEGFDPALNPYYNNYQLHYVADMGRWTLAEGLAIWKRKHGKTAEPVNNADSKESE